MFCTACAASNPRTSYFCNACGAPLVHRQPVEPDRQSGSRSRWITTLIYLIPMAMLLLSAAFVLQRVQSERDASAAAYERAEAALVGGDYEAAIASFAEAGDHLDAAARRDAAVAVLAPYQSDYLDGLAALNAGRFEEAVTKLLPVATKLPQYRDTMALLTEARTRWQDELIRTADIAEEQHNWLVAEKALTQAAINDPDNVDLANRLANVRQAHSPMLYTWNGALYMVGPDLSDEKLITSEVEVILPNWSPDRSKIAFFSPETEDLEDSVRLYVVNVDGSNLRQLADEVYFDGWAAWSPDGTKIAYPSGVLEVRQGLTKTSVKIVDLETGDIKTVTGPHMEYAFSPTWSPTGDRLAFISRQPRKDQTDDFSYRMRGDVYVLDLATGISTDVTRRRVPNVDQVSWSPVEDRLLMFDIDRNTPWYDNGMTNIAVLDLATDEIDEIKNQTQTLGMPFWAPDGSAFAFTEGDNVVRIRRFGQGDRWINLNQSVAQVIAWSPDSTSIIVVGGDGRDTSYLVSLDGATAEKSEFSLVFDRTSPRVGPPQWSPHNPATPPQIVWPQMDTVETK